MSQAKVFMLLAWLTVSICCSSCGPSVRVLVNEAVPQTPIERFTVTQGDRQRNDTRSPIFYLVRYWADENVPEGADPGMRKLFAFPFDLVFLPFTIPAHFIVCYSHSEIMSADIAVRLKDENGSPLSGKYVLWCFCF